MKSIKPSFMALLLFILIISGIITSSYGKTRVYNLEMHHRYSEPVQNWYASGSRPASYRWPKKGSIRYYVELAEHDRVLNRGRRISEDRPLTFSDGNSTFRISSLGFLHYTTVSLGSPGMKFLVALDTGSDLFWVPCDCTQCAPTEVTSSTSDFELSIYNPKLSSTSRDITCENRLCAQGNRCNETINQCPYSVSYVSSETSTTGVLLEDILKLKTEDFDQQLVEAHVIFGCGQVQTGSFLDIAAPNGLFGLGLEKISVPSILSTQGYIADSFSMCFGNDGTGRISLGDKGSSNLEVTPFNINPSRPTYNITITQMRMGTTIAALEITALFDSGTSFTYLVEPAYSKFTNSFHSQVQDRRRPLDPRIPFEYCYNMRPDANTSLVPTASLTMKGDGSFAIKDPLIVISTLRELVYCLAIIKSSELNIIGQNFMTGYKIVFDRENLALGWEKSSCYDIDDFSEILEKSHNSSIVAPAVVAEAGNNLKSAASPSLRVTLVISLSLLLHSVPGINALCKYTLICD